MQYDIIVIGAGAGGLVIAIGAASAKKRVLLIEKGHYGGDCTNFGCIPSKALIASAKKRHTILNSQEYGLKYTPPEIDASGVFERVRSIIQHVREHEEPPELEKLGLHTVTGEAHFVDAHTLEVDGKHYHGKNIVIATGSSPITPHVPGLDQTPFLNNERIFDLTSIPKNICFVGAGPISCELAQAMQRLGSQVTLVNHSSSILSREDHDAAKILLDQFQKEGITFLPEKKLKEVSHANETFSIAFEDGQTLQTEALFIGLGRRPNVTSLNLDKAGVKWSEKGLQVDTSGRTSQKHIWAVGDVIGSPFFTHYAENQARTVLANILLPFTRKKSRQALPRVTFTSPEVASIGVLEHDLPSKKGIAIYKIPLSEVDRALTAGETEGFIKVITKKWSSKILGATIVCERAGEMLMEISTAMLTKTSFRKLSGLIHPYPIYSQGIRKAADLWLKQTLLGIFKKS